MKCFELALRHKKGLHTDLLVDETIPTGRESQREGVETKQGNLRHPRADVAGPNRRATTELRFPPATLSV
jgi:hypothetical protein